MSGYRIPVRISEGEILSFLQDRGVRAACPHCPKVDWQLAETEDARGVALPILAPNGSIADKMILPVIPLTCRNCGYLWPIARQVVEEWLTERGKNGE